MPFSASLSRNTPEGKAAYSAPPARASGRIQPEHLGRARELRLHLGEAQLVWQTEVEALLRRFRPSGTVMKKSAKHFRRLEAAWKCLPARGGLRRFVKHAPDGGIQAGEVRVAPSCITYPDWHGDAERGIALTVITVLAGPGRYDEQMLRLGVVGEHAIARFFERGAAFSDNALSSALRTLIDNYDDVISRCEAELAANDALGLGRVGQFRIPAGGGQWVGAVALRLGDPLLRVQTFVPSVEARSGFKFDEVARLVRAGER